MANTFLTCQQIARMALPILRENLVFPALCYRDYSDEFAREGDTIQVRKPPVYEAKNFTNAVVVQDITEDNVLVTLDKIADVSVEITARQMALNLRSFEEQVIRPAAIAIAEKINHEGLALYKGVPYFTGTAGTTPDALDDFANARRILNTNKVPMSPRYAVWDPNADAAFSILPAIVNAEKSGSTQALREGSIGRIQGMDNFMSQGVQTHTKGTLAATGSGAKILLKGAADNAKTITLDTGGTALAGTLKAGDMLTIGTVTATVAEDATAASDEIEVKLIRPVTAADNAEVTVGGDYTANLAFHKNAFAFVSRPLELARGVESYVTSFENLTLRVTFGYDMTAKKQMLSIDTLYGYKTLYPELAVKVLG